MIIIFTTILIFTAAITWLWVQGIDNMKKNHPGYDGSDLFDE
jgi:hypothetical protein